MNVRKLQTLYLFLLALALLTMIVLYRVIDRDPAIRDYRQIRDDGFLNVVMEYTESGYRLSGDSIPAIQYDLCKFIADRSRLEVNIFLEKNLEKCIGGLEKGTYDVIARNIPVTIPGREQLSFTIPVTRDKLVLIQRKTDKGVAIRNQIDLSGKTIHVLRNSPAILRLKNLGEEIGEEIHIREIDNHTREQLLHLVAYEEIDYAVIDREVAEANRPLFPEIDFQTEISFTQLHAWAVRKETPVLLDSLNIWIREYLEKSRNI